MRCAIIPVFCSGTQRRTELSVAWLKRLAKAVEAYYDQQSGGRANLTCKVFDWRQISQTTNEWLAAKAYAGRVTYESMISDGLFARTDFDHFVVMIDDAISSGGVTPLEAPETSLIAAAGVTATIVEHELGHRLLAAHTFLDSPAGPVEYGGPFCVMGHEGSKYAFTDTSLDVPGEGASQENCRNGPGMCFANLVNAGWATPSQHAVMLHPYSTGNLSTVIELAALEGVPQSSGSNPAIACIVDLEDWFIVEYRSDVAHYDMAVPNTAPPSSGNLTVYRSAPGGFLNPLQVKTCAVYPGQVLTIEEWPQAIALAKKIGGTLGTALQLTVLSVAPGNSKVSLRIERKLGKPPQYERTDDLMDFLQFASVGREIIQDDQPNAITLIKQLTEIQHLSRMRSISGPSDRAALQQALDAQVFEFQEISRRFRG